MPHPIFGSYLLILALNRCLFLVFKSQREKHSCFYAGFYLYYRP